MTSKKIYCKIFTLSLRIFGIKEIQGVVWSKEWVVVRSEEWEEHRALLHGYRPSVLQDRKVPKATVPMVI